MLETDCVRRLLCGVGVFLPPLSADPLCRCHAGGASHASVAVAVMVPAERELREALTSVYPALSVDGVTALSTYAADTALNAACDGCRAS